MVYPSLQQTAPNFQDQIGKNKVSEILVPRQLPQLQKGELLFQNQSTNQKTG